MLIMMIYIGCVLVAFKVIKLKVNTNSIAVSTLIGVFVLGGIVVTWKLSSPMTDQLTLRRIVVQITPDVREFVSRVHVESNELVYKGQPLFEISKERFQNAVEQANASLAAAEAKVLQLEAGVEAAEASIVKADADTAVAKSQIDTAKKLRRSLAGSVAKVKIQTAQASYNAAVANSQASRSALLQARSSLNAGKSLVDELTATLRQAEFNLSRTTYRSPVDGRVINFQVREQTPVARWQFASVGTLMDLSDTAVLAVLPQNLLKYVKAGDDVEMAFRRMPGTIATGKVEAVVKYTGEGQFAASARLPEVVKVGSKGLLVVRIRLDDEELAKTLPLGAAGTTAIYTDFGKPFHLISKIALRMKGWLYYIPV